MYLALIGDVPASSGHELPFSQPTYDSRCYFVWFHRSFGKGSVSEQAIERAPRRASNVSSAAARSCSAIGLMSDTGACGGGCGVGAASRHSP